MTRNDWIGMGASVGVHATLLLVCALLTAGRPTTPTLGALRLEVGAFAEGRPVQQSESPADAPGSSEETEQTPPDEADQQPAEAQPAQQQSEQMQPRAASSEEGAPVDLPEQEEESPGEEPPPEEPPDEADQETPPAPERASDAASDERASEENPSEPETSAEETTPERSASSAGREGGEQTSETTGNASGEQGSGSDEERASPFDIEGLDRTRLHGPLPQYTEKVNATIEVKITVNPQGRVIGQQLVRKANPSLERSVREALRQWRFNRLPSGAPQETQTGVVTFRFRLE